MVRKRECNHRADNIESSNVLVKKFVLVNGLVTRNLY